MWKIKEIDFLELVIGINSIKIQKEKIIGILK